jgi:RNA polymerase sigma-70 factor (ECF subfamily)
MAEIERLYAATYRHFVDVARGITGSGESARDAVQDGFAGAIRARDSYRGVGSLEAWLWRSVVNAALKSRRPRLTEVGADLGEAPAPGEVAALAPLVAALPQRQRLVVFLRYYADLDYRSIAQVLEVEVGTVSATLAAAHRSIRRALTEVKADA